VAIVGVPRRPSSVPRSSLTVRPRSERGLDNHRISLRQSRPPGAGGPAPGGGGKTAQSPEVPVHVTLLGRSAWQVDLRQPLAEGAVLGLWALLPV